MTPRSNAEARAMAAEVRAIVRKWQKRLGMSEWDIEVKIERDLNGALGDSLVLNPEARWAQIAIAADCPRHQLEPTVVHELLEILLARLSEIALSGMREAHFNRWEMEKERLVEFATRRLLTVDRASAQPPAADFLPPRRHSRGSARKVCQEEGASEAPTRPSQLPPM